MSVRRIVSAGKGAAAEACAQHVLAVLGEAVRANGSATLAVSGGSSPKPMFARMAAAQFDWQGVHIFWVDERCVPPTDSASNYKFVDESLIQPAGIPATQVHRVEGEMAPAEAAARYAGEFAHSSA
jgi:6-phosphogluconolactonase